MHCKNGLVKITILIGRNEKYMVILTFLNSQNCQQKKIGKVTLIKGYFLPFVLVIKMDSLK